MPLGVTLLELRRELRAETGTSLNPNQGTQAQDTMTTRPVAARTGDGQWYPDHGVINANKDQLKAMPQFKYSNYN